MGLNIPRTEQLSLLQKSGIEYADLNVLSGIQMLEVHQLRVFGIKVVDDAGLFEIQLFQHCLHRDVGLIG